MWCRDAAAGSLTDRRSQHQALALSPVDGRHAPGNRQALQISCWTSNTSSEQGSDPAAPRVHQQSIQNYRPQEGSPVSTTVEAPAPDLGPEPVTARRGGIRFLFARHTYGFAVVLGVVLLVANLVKQPSFGVTSQLAALAPLGIAAMASVPSIMSGRGGIDLSISPLMTLCGLLYATQLQPNGLGGYAALPLLMLAGAL